MGHNPINLPEGFKHRGFSEGFCQDWDDLRFVVSEVENWSWFSWMENHSKFCCWRINSSNSALPILISGKFGQYFRGEELRLGDKQAQAVEKVFITDRRVGQTGGKHHLSMRYQWWLIMFDIPICQNPWWLIMMVNNHLSMRYQWYPNMFDGW